MSADSEQPEGGLATNAIDGNPATIWHTAYTPTTAPLPHAFSIAVRSSHVLTGLRYQPRTDHPNGRIGQYQIHLSIDNTNWGAPVAVGTFADDAAEKTVTFTPTAAIFIRLTALTEAGSRGPWSSAAEIDAIWALQCGPTAPIYSTRSNGVFIQSPHLRPEAGSNSWGTQQQISTGELNARRIAGPDGIIYSAVSNGELQRRRWNGTGWDTFAGGAQYEVIDTNPLWARYSTPEYFNRITVDPNGYIYTIEPDGSLYWRLYSPTTGSWMRRQVYTGWGRFDIIVAVRSDLLLAREPRTNALYAVKYHAPSQREDWSVRWLSNNGQEWDKLVRMFSPGGGLLYGITSSGELRWWQFHEGFYDGTRWDPTLEPSAGKLIGTGWQGQYETSAAPDACTLIDENLPTRPQVAPQPNAPVTLMRSTDGHMHYSYVDAEGRAVYAEITSIFGGAPAGAAAVPGITNVTGITSTAENQDGRIQLIAVGPDSEVLSSTRTSVNGPWGTSITLGGFVSSPAILTRRPNNTLTAWGLEPLGPYGNGRMWYLDQVSANGPMGVWDWSLEAIIGTRIYQFVTQNSRAILLSGSPEMVRVEWIPDSGGVDGWDFLAFDDVRWFMGAAAAELPDNRVQVFAATESGDIYTVREPVGGFTWPLEEPTAISGVTAGGPPSATLAPDGLVKIVVRGADGYIYYTSENAPGSNTFTPWQEITNFTEQTATDPTALAAPEGNTWVVAYRNDLDVPRLRRYVAGQGAVAATESGIFSDVPIIPPS